MVPGATVMVKVAGVAALAGVIEIQGTLAVGVIVSLAVLLTDTVCVAGVAPLG